MIFPRSFSFLPTLWQALLWPCPFFLPLFLFPFLEVSHTFLRAQVGRRQEFWQRFQRLYSHLRCATRLSCFSSLLWLSLNFWNGGLVWYQINGLKLFLFSWRWFLFIGCCRGFHKAYQAIPKGQTECHLVLASGWLPGLWRTPLPRLPPNITTATQLMDLPLAQMREYWLVDVMGQAIPLTECNSRNYSLETYNGSCALTGLPWLFLVAWAPMFRLRSLWKQKLGGKKMDDYIVKTFWRPWRCQSPDYHDCGYGLKFLLALFLYSEADYCLSA